MTRRGLVLAALLVTACGGSEKPQDATVSNRQGAVVSGAPKDQAGTEPFGDARVMQRTQSGGVIELVGDRSTSMRRADNEMSDHCGPDNFTIVQEGEEAVVAADGRPRADTAWRVHYECNGAHGSP